MREASERLDPASRARAVRRDSHDSHGPGLPPAVALDARALTPTLLEWWAVRRTLPRVRPLWTGVRLARWRGAPEGSAVVICGLAGALTPDLRAGAVLAPEWVGRPDGTIMRCDAGLMRALLDAATALGFQPETGPLLTAPTLVTGPDREMWARRGYVAADMETGLLADARLRVATVRVILDDAENPISEQWLTPLRALLRPSAWRELWWLRQAAPAYSLRAAEVLKAASRRFAPPDPG
jgi:phosphorylase superfamily protein